MASQLDRTSKLLSFLLRHRPNSIGLQLVVIAIPCNLVVALAYYLTTRA